MSINHFRKILDHEEGTGDSTISKLNEYKYCLPINKDTTKALIMCLACVKIYGKPIMDVFGYEIKLLEGRLFEIYSTITELEKSEIDKHYNK